MGSAYSAHPFPLSGAAALPGTSGGTAKTGSSGGFSVCTICHGPARAGCSLCWSCRRVRLGLGRRPVPSVLPMVLVAPRGGAHRALVAYKASRSPECRRRATDALVGLARPWLARHLTCCSGPDRAGAGAGASASGWSGAGPVRPGAALSWPLLVVPVPSTVGGRPSWDGRHPVELLLEAALGDDARDEVSICRALEPRRAPPARLVPRPDGFAACEAVRDRQCVVFDDLFVSGSRALSAAAALEDAGAAVRAVVTLARFVRPEHNLAASLYWECFGGVRADLSRCAACAHEERSPSPMKSPRERLVVRARSKTRATTALRHSGVATQAA
jgi:hypothetical protein